MPELTSDQLAKIRTLRQQGRSPYDIARTLDVPETAVRAALRRLGMHTW